MTTNHDQWDLQALSEDMGGDLEDPDEMNGKPATNIPSFPFRRKRTITELSGETNRFNKEVLNLVNLLEPTAPEESAGAEPILAPINVKEVTDLFAERWKLKGAESEVAFQGLLLVLEKCLLHEMSGYSSFQHFVSVLGYHTVFFWKKAIPHIYESDLAFGTQFRDALLFSLTLYDVNTGQNRLRELYAAVPGIRKSLLGVHAKQFEEKFYHCSQRRSSFSTKSSSVDPLEQLNIQELEDEDEIDITLPPPHSTDGAPSPLTIGEQQNGESTNDVKEEKSDSAPPSPPPAAAPEGTRLQTVPEDEVAHHNSATDVVTSAKSHSGSTGGSSSLSIDNDEPPEKTMGGGLADGQFQQRVINVSNAPPVSLKASDSGNWSIEQGSGGLVACVDPVMSQDTENVWLANMQQVKWTPSRPETPHVTNINSLGLPIVRQGHMEVLMNIMEDTNIYDDEDDLRKEVRRQMSLLGVLKNYGKQNYKLTPVEVSDSDYNTYYGGISNGLLWPALHNLSEYIVKDYDSPEVLREHWNSYVRVNYHFALNAVRNSRSQDFIWIHDYHLLLTGQIMGSLDPNMDAGFFLHIPFQLPDDFFDKFKLVGMAMLRGLLRFNKVGFQTHRDRNKFVQLTEQHLGRNAKVNYDRKADIYIVSHDGWTSSLGVFPVSIKCEEFISISKKPEVVGRALELKTQIQEASLPGGKIFFSVERFDYTKGIYEKLVAWRRYFEKYPQRIGKDVLLQLFEQYEPQHGGTFVSCQKGFQRGIIRFGKSGETTRSIYGSTEYIRFQNRLCPVHIYNDLVNKDKQLYTQNGILHMLERNRRIKKQPQRFQESEKEFDVIICLEERVYDQIVEDMTTRKHGGQGNQVHVINIDIQDNHEEATIGAFFVCELCALLEACQDVDNEIDELLTEFENKCSRTILHTLCFY